MPDARDRGRLGELMRDAVAAKDANTRREPMTTPVEHSRLNNHRITVTRTVRGYYYNLERWVVCGCPHCNGHWKFVAGSDTPPHHLLLRDVDMGGNWQWSRRVRVIVNGEKITIEARPRNG